MEDTVVAREDISVVFWGLSRPKGARPTNNHLREKCVWFIVATAFSKATTADVCFWRQLICRDAISSQPLLQRCVHRLLSLQGLFAVLLLFFIFTLKEEISLHVGLEKPIQPLQSMDHLNRANSPEVLVIVKEYLVVALEGISVALLG